MSYHHFGFIDWSVLVVYAGTLLGIGFYLSRYQRTNNDFFLGHRRSHPFLAGISIFAAVFSIISYVGTPGEYIQYGPVLVFLGNLMIIPVLFPLVGWFLIPAIMRLPITSAYELLEARLGHGVRQAGSVTYIVTRLLWMSLILFVSASVLENVLGYDPHRAWLLMGVIGLVTTTYTLFGGIRTVMITESVQFFVLLSGALITIASVSWKLGGIAPWWPRHEAYWPRQPFFSGDMHTRVTVVTAFVAWLIVGLTYAGSDQAAIQRFLTTREVRPARRAYLLTLFAVITVCALLGLVGAAVLGFFRLHPEAIPGDMSFAKNGDAFFPLYISHFLPTGISGLVVASLLAAAMSCLSSGLTAVVTVITKDFVEHISALRGRTEAAQMRLTRILVVILAVVVVCGGIGVGSIRGDIYEVMTKTGDLLTFPVFGLFVLAIFVKFSTGFGAVLGATYGISASVIVGYWGALTGGRPISFLWIAPISLTVTVLAGCLLSRLPTRGRPRRVVAAYAVAVLIPLPILIRLIIG